MRLLADERTPFCEPHIKHLSIEKYKRLYEMRLRSAGMMVRVIFYEHAGEVVLLHAFYKRGKKDTEIPIRPLADRHDVYYDFLSMLHLEPHHLANLKRRGLSAANIRQFLYKSIPLDDVFRAKVLEKLASQYDLLGIPGFYRDSAGNWQMFLRRCGGIFIPVCDKDGYIQGLQMRLDVPNSEKKFRWFSSNHYPDGTRAQAWIHIVGDVDAGYACLTEGPMKADITSVLSDGLLLIAVPGVNAIQLLPDILRGLEVLKIYEAFDMDKRSKPEVKQALIALQQTIASMGIAYQSCSWDARYKGIDDYYLAKRKAQMQSIAA